MSHTSFSDGLYIVWWWVIYRVYSHLGFLDLDVEVDLEVWGEFVFLKVASTPFPHTPSTPGGGQEYRSVMDSIYRVMLYCLQVMGYISCDDVLCLPVMGYI